MSKLVDAGRSAGMIGAWLGIATAGAAVGFAAERYVMGRSLRRGDEHADEPFGSLRGEPRAIRTDDGVALHVEIDEPAEPAVSPDVTFVFCHGFALTQDSWHFQRRALRDRARLVFWDQRGHGRSGPLPDGAEVSVGRLGADLGHVLDDVVPAGPVILAAHSMGGMAVMALAAARPELFGERIVGSALIATSAGRLDLSLVGLPRRVARLAGRVAPGAVSLLARRPELVEQGRRMGGDLGYVLTRRYGFADGRSPRLVQFTAGMNAAVPIDVVAEFFPLFAAFDVDGAIPSLARIPTVVVTGERDVLTPVTHGRELAERLSDVRYVEASGAGHMVLLERHEVVTDSLHDLLSRALGARRR